jgi:hypothetical protein
MRIGICAPSTPFTREDAARVVALAAQSHPEAELVFDDQCFVEQGHFAGSDASKGWRRLYAWPTTLHLMPSGLCAAATALAGLPKMQ